MEAVLILYYVTMNNTPEEYDEFSLLTFLFNHNFCMHGSIYFEYSQRVYPNTHCSGIDESKGLQWVGANVRLS